MFWGITLKALKDNVAFMTERPFRLCNVALEPPSAQDPLPKKIQLYMVNELKVEFMVCQLDENNMNASLDTLLDVDGNITFRVKGQGTVHLTGYYEDDFESGFSDDTEVVESAQHMQGLKLSGGGQNASFGEPNFGSGK